MTTGGDHTAMTTGGDHTAMATGGDHTAMATGGDHTVCTRALKPASGNNGVGRHSSSDRSARGRVGCECRPRSEAGSQRRGGGVVFGHIRLGMVV